VRFHIYICARNHSHHIRLVKVVKRRFTSHWHSISLIVIWVV
jgi:hypothetical protein